MTSWPVVRTANLDFVRGGDRSYVRWLCTGSDLVLAQECKDLVLRDLVPEGFRALQDLSSPATAGAALLVRKATLEVRGFHLVHGARPFIGGRRIGMLDRYLAVGHLVHRESEVRWTGVSGHFPPPRFRPLQPGYSRVLRRVVANHVRCVVGVDANQSVHQLARQLGMDDVSTGIVGLLSEVDLRHPEVLTWGPRHGVTDHPAVEATANLSQLV